MNVLEIISSKYWSYRLLVKSKRNYVINKDERDRDRDRDRVRKKESKVFISVLVF